MSEKKQEPPRSSVKLPETIASDVVTKLEADHGEILLVKTILGQVAFKNPDRHQFQRFHKDIHNDKQRYLAGENLIRACIIHPDLGTFDAMLNAKPGIGSTCANALTEFAGSDGDADQKKVGTV